MKKKSLNAAIALLFIIGLATVSGHVSAAVDIPPGIQYSLGNVPALSLFVYENLDVAALREEDRQNGKWGVPMRIGVNRQVPALDASDGEIIDDPGDGGIWRFDIQSPGALKLRVHFTGCRLADGDRLYVYAPDASGPVDYYTGGGPFDTSDFWSWETRGDRVRIEWRSTRTITGRSLPFRIADISHAYIDPVADMMREGDCHNDVTCDVSYRHQRDASAYIEFTDGGWYLCSGTMINNSARDFTPYFITAAHCISSESAANTIKVFFFFHTQNCGDGSAAKGTRLQGAHLLATTSTESGPDCTLLELTSTGFEGVYFAGWDRNALASGVPVTSIHHPDGAFKRISYGTVTGHGSTKWSVRWDRTANPGVTEQGSSGGGLFRDSNHYFVGQLYGGYSSCSNQNGVDYYGDFGLAFTTANLQTWLGNADSLAGEYYNSGAPTPTPTHPPAPSPTPDPGCDIMGCTVRMPAESYTTGDTCYCDVLFCNPDMHSYTDYPLLVLLDVYGEYLFAPSFSDFDYYTVDIAGRETVVSVVPAFTWPEVDGAASGLTWYAALLTSNFSEIIGEIGSFTFGWY